MTNINKIKIIVSNGNGEKEEIELIGYIEAKISRRFDKVNDCDFHIVGTTSRDFPPSDVKIFSSLEVTY